MTGIELIAAERQRQIDAEGWSPEHDDKHDGNQLSMAAACYAAWPCELKAHISAPCGCRTVECPHTFGISKWVEAWPWGKEWWKPTHGLDDTSRIRNLEKAGALIAAEIDRLQRRTR